VTVYVLERNEHERYADRVFATLESAMAAFPVAATESPARCQQAGGWHELKADDGADAEPVLHRCWWNGYTFSDMGLILEMEVEP
jgi:hypothetical protein